MEKNIDGISVEIIRRKIKNMHLYVLPPEGRVRVTAPLCLPEREIDAFVRAKRAWIDRHRENITRRCETNRKERQYITGETMRLWGSKYNLRVESGPPSLRFNDGEAVLTCTGDVDVRRGIVREEYRELFRVKAAWYLEKWSAVTGLRPAEWRTKYMITRWGTCNSSAGRIWLNPYLACFSEECLDYVVLHEMLHLKIPNHSSQFKSELDHYMKEWREREKILKCTVPVDFE